MKELIHNHFVRLIIYCAISTLSLTTIYGSFFVTSVYHQAMVNKASIERIDKEMMERKLYIARFEKSEALQKQDHITLERMAERMKDVVHMLLNLKIVKH